jgi:predicted nucleic acid-binding protein
VIARSAPGGLLDTSVFIARESGRRVKVEAIPSQAAVSIVTKAELRAGVLTAPDDAARGRRITTLELLTRMAVLPIDEIVAAAWAQMRAYLAASGKRVGANDIWIAATAAAYEVPVLTQDGDFDHLSGVAGLTVIPV